MIQAKIAPLKKKPTSFKGREIFCSKALTDRKSVFVAHAVQVHDSDEAREFKTSLRNTIAESHPSKPTHEITAWRVPASKRLLSGEIKYITGSDDDGEKYGGACIEKVLDSRDARELCVIVSRWYGGEMLGPVRFQHIAQVANEVLDQYNDNEERRKLELELRELEIKIKDYTEKDSKEADLNNRNRIRIPIIKPLDSATLQRLIKAKTSQLEWLKANASLKANTPPNAIASQESSSLGNLSSEAIDDTCAKKIKETSTKGETSNETNAHDQKTQETTINDQKTVDS